MKISACLITLNAAATLDACLASLDFADEILVRDQGSTDETLSICARYGARVVHGEWLGFGPTKAAATAAARNRWVLSIDADERITPELREAIRALPDEPAPAAYAVNRLSRFLGRWMRHGGWHPDWVVRLFDRERAAFNAQSVHESVVTEDRVERLEGLLLHEAYDDLHQWLRKQNLYGSLAAEEAVARGERGSLACAVVRGHLAFARTYLLQQGWREGAHGLALCQLTAFATYLKHLKIWLAARAREDRHT
ncbi:glycosyltransferase family 2 protein [bacterium]|nr:glycosyltransferase family 2 protein [bacterium]